MAYEQSHFLLLDADCWVPQRQQNAQSEEGITGNVVMLCTGGKPCGCYYDPSTPNTVKSIPWWQ